MGSVDAPASPHEFVSATADIRGDYRYRLTRVWDPTLPTITFVLLNPSTADAEHLDPTLRRCVGFAKRDGFGGMVILNLYAFRSPSPSPKLMRAAVARRTNRSEPAPLRLLRKERRLWRSGRSQSPLRGRGRS